MRGAMVVFTALAVALANMCEGFLKGEKFIDELAKAVVCDDRRQ